MYKVVIIDDEPIIVKGLTRLTPWQEYDCEVVGSAGDGQEGLELIRSVHPNIVFSDIYMPKMDGLLMAAALKSEFEDLELSILTGYRDFDLLQQALRLGATRYILKPSSMEELEEALKAMTEKLRKRGIYPVERCDLPGEDKDRQSVQAKDSQSEQMKGLQIEQAKDSQSEQAEDMENERAEDPQNEQAGSFLVHHAIAYMKKNYTRKVTLKEVADNVYVSQWHLSKLLNGHTGQSFSELLNTIRIDAAKELLKDPSLRIGDVAEEVGFLDLAHFSRVFKKIIGVSANEYRNNMDVEHEKQ